MIKLDFKNRLTNEDIEIIQDKLEINNSNLTLDKIIEKYRNMYYRCYSDNYHQSHPYYEGCTICDAWQDESDGLYNFSIWCIDNYYEIEGEATVQLDKDILVKGNKVYSPDTCCFVPKRINSMFSKFVGKSDTGLPTGVSQDKTTGKYKPFVQNYDGKILRNVGHFDTVQEAWEVYAQHRKANIIVIADSYKDNIPDKLYQAMIDWQVDITD